jgi:hypothetical protein
VNRCRLVTAAVAVLCESSWYPVAGGVDDERLVDVLQRALPRLIAALTDVDAGHAGIWGDRPRQDPAAASSLAAVHSIVFERDVLTGCCSSSFL